MTKYMEKSIEELHSLLKNKEVTSAELIKESLEPEGILRDGSRSLRRRALRVSSVLLVRYAQPAKLRLRYASLKMTRLRTSTPTTDGANTPKNNNLSVHLYSPKRERRCCSDSVFCIALWYVRTNIIT